MPEEQDEDRAPEPLGQSEYPSVGAINQNSQGSNIFNRQQENMLSVQNLASTHAQMAEAFSAEKSNTHNDYCGAEMLEQSDQLTLHRRLA